METLNLIKDFLLVNYPSILFAIFAISGFILMGKKAVLSLVVTAMLEAEKYLADSGEAKKDYVVQLVMERLPNYLKPFVRKEDVAVIVEVIIKYIKNDYNKRKEQGNI